MDLLDLSPCLTDPPAHGPRARATHHDQFARGPHRPGRARLRHITAMDVCKMSCARRDIVAPERTLVELCQAFARETLFLVTVSPHVLCILASVAMIAEVSKPRSLPFKCNVGEMCVFIMLMGTWLPVVQATHALEAERMDGYVDELRAPIVAGDNSSHRALQTLATCALPADTVSVSSTMTPLELVVLLCTTLSHHW